MNDELLISMSSKIKHTSVKPGAIRVGQLVEVQVGLRLYSAKDTEGQKTYMLSPKLRAICILDSAALDVRNF